MCKHSDLVICQSSRINFILSLIREDFSKARQRKLSPERKAFIDKLIADYQPEDAEDIQDMMKAPLGYTLQGRLEAEIP